MTNIHISTITQKQGGIAITVRPMRRRRRRVPLALLQ
jgi:hypothetical protein